MKADPMSSAKASTHPAHMDRLLDGITVDQKLSMNYLCSTWEYRSKATSKDVFKVGLKLTNDLGTKNGILGAKTAVLAASIDDRDHRDMILERIKPRRNRIMKTATNIHTSSISGPNVTSILT